MVAKEAGVSPTAVSLALRGQPKISPSTRAKILKVTARLGYQPSPLVRQLMSEMRRAPERRTTLKVAMINLWDHAMDQGPEEPLLYHYLGALQKARDLKYSCLLIGVGNDTQQRKTLAKRIRFEAVDGILVFPSKAKNHLIFSEIERLSLPKVSVGGVVEPGDLHVVADHYENTRKAGLHLLEKRCERIGIALSPFLANTKQFRFLGGYFSLRMDSAWVAEPLVESDLPRKPKIVADYIVRNRLDGLLIEPLCKPDEIRQLSGPTYSTIGIVGFAGSYAADKANRLSGIDEGWSRIGELAMSHLDRLIINRNNALLECGENILVPGIWDPPNQRKTNQATVAEMTLGRQRKQARGSC